MSATVKTVAGCPLGSELVYSFWTNMRKVYRIFHHISRFSQREGPVAEFFNSATGPFSPKNAIRFSGKDPPTGRRPQPP